MSDKNVASKDESQLAKKSASLLDQAKAKAQSFGTDLAKSATEKASQAVSNVSDKLKTDAANNLLTKAVTFADSNQVAKQASSALSGLADGQVPTVDQVKASVSSIRGAEEAPKDSANGSASKGSQPTSGGDGQNDSGPRAQSSAGAMAASKDDESKPSNRADAKDKRGDKGKTARLAQLSSTAQPFSQTSDSSAPMPGTTAAITSAVVQMLADDQKEDGADPILEFFTSNNN